MADLVPASVMRAAQAADEAAMPSLCRIYKPTRTPDDRGGYTRAFILRPAVKGGICRVTYANTIRKEGEQGGRLSSSTDVVISFPIGTVVNSDDEIEADNVGPLGESVTERYQALGIGGQGSYATNYTVSATKIG
jgi:hypothetical protein